MPEDNAVEMIERDARLFEAGDYPDRGITVTEDDLDSIVANHQPVEIGIEHEPNPLKLGMVTKLWRAGKELFGKMTWTPAAWALVDESNAKGLSIGLKRDKSALTEVSIVRHPRVVGSQVFSDDTVIEFSADVDWSGHPHDEVTTSAAQITKSVIPTEEVKTMPDKAIETTVAEDIAAISTFRAEKGAGTEFAQNTAAIMSESRATREELREVADQSRAAVAEMQAAKCEMAIARFKQDGKIVPSTEEFARAILSHKPLKGVVPSIGETVTFSDKPMHFAEVFEAFLDAMPPVVNFREMIRNQDAETLSAETISVGAKLGVDADTIRKHKDR